MPELETYSAKLKIKESCDCDWMKWKLQTRITHPNLTETEKPRLLSPGGVKDMCSVKLLSTVDSSQSWNFCKIKPLPALLVESVKVETIVSDTYRWENTSFVEIHSYAHFKDRSPIWSCFDSCNKHDKICLGLCIEGGMQVLHMVLNSTSLKKNKTFLLRVKYCFYQ